ncbi:Ig domain-containing protein [Tropheryma whipplei]|uniref:Ig domain-containing protein n=1 Tax=Tropheryma whipplei TaxID=2039 RepID=UPI0009B65CDD|nr:Ig domain-containing protein [Tropheryma whipplei]
MSYTVTNTTETSPTTNGGLPKGLSIDATNGTITGSIDTGVTPGEYVAIITVTYSSNSKTEVSPSTVTYILNTTLSLQLSLHKCWQWWCAKYQCHA